MIPLKSSITALIFIFFFGIQTDIKMENHSNTEIIPGFVANDFECPDSLTAKDFGIMLLEAEFAGRHAIEGEESLCLQQERFPHIRVFHFPPQDAGGNSGSYFIKSYEVGELEALDENTRTYKLHFTVNAVDSQRTDKVPEVFEDSITFLLHTSERVYRVRGCAGILEPPQNVYLKKECFTD